MPRADPPRFEVDRAWLLRAGIVVAVLALIALVVKVSLMVFGGSGSQRLERHERAGEGKPPTSRESTAPRK